MTQTLKQRIIILGLGNILCGDEGFGVRVAERLYAKYDFPEWVSIVDGGTQGQTLYPFVEEAARLLIFDAVDFGLAPGQLVVKKDSGVPVWLSARKMSVHQNSFSEVLALARLKNALPREIILIGVQPVDMTYGAGLTDIVKSRLPEASKLGLEQLRSWGIVPEKTQIPKSLNAPSVSMMNYEAHPGRCHAPEPSVFRTKR